MAIPNGEPPAWNIPQLSERLDQSIADFKLFMERRFADHEAYEKMARQGDIRLLDERFKTQTTTLDAAFAAAEKARQEALSTAKDDAARTDARIKAIEDKQTITGGRSLGRADILGWVVAAASIISFIIYATR
jgi:hypothetical protein